jgi:hypothetical protein
LVDTRDFKTADKPSPASLVGPPHAAPVWVINRLASFEQFVPLKNQRHCHFVANQKGFKIPCFLSCLYGSELRPIRYASLDLFLSRLYGVNAAAGALANIVIF